jgi:hypothetical protein
MGGPADVDAAFEWADPRVGVAVIGLALHGADLAAVLPRVCRALRSDDAELRRQGLVALGHAARLHRGIDGPSLALLRRLLHDTTRIRSGSMMVKGTADDAAGDVWQFVPHRELPGWLRRRQWAIAVRFRIWDRWRYR